MECKFQQLGNDIAFQGGIKIYPEWNVNVGYCNENTLRKKIKIYPEWNVNVFSSNLSTFKFN